MSIAELALVGKPAILVPSPVVAEDHQTKNARSLSDRGGALLLEDSKVEKQLGSALLDLFHDPEKAQSMAKSMKEAARPHAASDVVDAIEALILS